MKIKYLEFLTNKYNQMINITQDIEALVESSGIKKGMITVQTMHTTTGIMMNESLECLESDIETFFNRLVPEDIPYTHARMLDDYGSTAGNPTGHLKSILYGTHCHLFVDNYKIMKGGAQEVYFIELDGPSQRKVMVTIIEL